MFLDIPYSTGTLCAAVFVAFTLSVAAQKPEPAPAEAPGPWVLGPIGVGEDTKTTAANGIAIKIGEQGEAAVAYDLDLCRIIGAWTGKFVAPANPTSPEKTPMALGDVAFITGSTAGLIPGTAKPEWQDPRPAPSGPLPKGQARFKGFVVNGGKTILQWDIDGTEVLEMPAYDVVLNGGGYFTRTFFVAPSLQPTQILVAGQPQVGDPYDVPAHRKTEGEVPGLEDKERIMQSTPWIHGDHGEVMVWAAGDPEGSVWRKVDSQLAIEIPRLGKGTTFQIAYWIAPDNDPDGHGAPLFFRAPEIDLPALVRTGTAHPAEADPEAAKN